MNSIEMSRTLIKNARLEPVLNATLYNLEICSGCIGDIVIASEQVNKDEIEYDTIVDAKGAVVFPGMQDSHIHVAMLGESLHYVNLSECYSIESLVCSIEEKIRKEPNLPFVVGYNWDQTKLGRMPCRKDIDHITSKPIFLWRACWHIGIANSATLELTSMLVEKKKEDLVLDQATHEYYYSFTGGAIDYEYDTLLPTGVLRERACEPVMAALAKFKSKDVYLQFIQEGLAVCLRKGITMVHTNDDHSLDLYKQLQSTHLLPIRVLLTPNQQELEEESQVATLKPFPLFKEEDIVDNKRHPLDAGHMSSRLGMNRVKIFSDGSLGAETAAMKVLPTTLDTTNTSEEPESKGLSYKGILMHSPQDMEHMILSSTNRGFRVEIHAIGDAAAEQVVSAIETCNRQRLDQGLPPIERPLITHCQVLGAEIVRRMHAHNVIANIQPSFVPTDMRWVMNRMSDERQLRYAYAWKTLLHGDHVVHCAGGSDAPIEDASPWFGVYDAMFRTNKWRLSESERATAAVVFRPEEKLSFPDALALYTTGGAYAAGYEECLGRVTVGQVADLVLMDVPGTVGDVNNNNRESEWDWLMTVSPDVVMIGGQVTYVKPDVEHPLVEIVKEDSRSVNERHGFFRFVPQEPAETQDTHHPIDGSAPFIPGKNGTYACLPAVKKQGSGRRGYCRCMLHMEYCM